MVEKDNPLLDAIALLRFVSWIFMMTFIVSTKEQPWIVFTVVHTFNLILALLIALAIPYVMYKTKLTKTQWMNFIAIEIGYVAYLIAVSVIWGRIELENIGKEQTNEQIEAKRSQMRTNMIMIYTTLTMWHTIVNAASAFAKT